MVGGGGEGLKIEETFVVFLQIQYRQQVTYAKIYAFVFNNNPHFISGRLASKIGKRHLLWLIILMPVNTQTELSLA